MYEIIAWCQDGNSYVRLKYFYFLSIYFVFCKIQNQELTENNAQLIEINEQLIKEKLDISIRVASLEVSLQKTGINFNKMQQTSLDRINIGEEKIQQLEKENNTLNTHVMV